MKKLAIGFCLIACVLALTSCDLGLDGSPSGDDIEKFYNENWAYTKNTVSKVDSKNSINAEFEISATVYDNTIIETVEKFSFGSSTQNKVTKKNTKGTLVIENGNLYFNNTPYLNQTSLPYDGKALYSLSSPEINTSVRWHETKTYKYATCTISQTFTVINGKLNASLEFSGSYPYKIEVLGNIIGSEYVTTGVKLNGKAWDDTQIDHYRYILNNIISNKGFLHLV